jgi:hypothetical protein
MIPDVCNVQLQLDMYELQTEESEKAAGEAHETAFKEGVVIASYIHFIV